MLVYNKAPADMTRMVCGVLPTNVFETGGNMNITKGLVIGREMVLANMNKNVGMHLTKVSMHCLSSTADIFVLCV